MQLNHLKNIINNLLMNSLSILKDENYQRMVWFRNEGTDESIPTETLDHFLGNSEIILNDQSCIQQLGEQNFSLLKKVHDLVKDYIETLEKTIDMDCIEENELLENPKWKSILGFSNELYIKLANFISRNTNEN